MSVQPLPHTFYNRPTLDVARDLLGCVLVHMVDGQPVSGRIVETEAYVGAEDQACHARHGKTARNALMFGPPGYAYVYFTYGMHWLLNAVTEAADMPCAVLIRAIEPLAGHSIIAANRAGRPQREWTSGPAKLTRALAIDGAHNGLDLAGDKLFITPGAPVADDQVQTGPRVGLGGVPEPWYSLPWRCWIDGNPHVSKWR